MEKLIIIKRLFMVAVFVHFKYIFANTLFGVAIKKKLKVMLADRKHFLNKNRIRQI